MLRKDTLLEINADLDRDRIRAIHRNGNRIEREFEEKETSEHQNGGEEIDIESREHMRAYRHMMKIYSAFAMFFGINVSYSYRPTRSYMFWFANFMLIATWTNIIYTVTFHCKNGQYKRVLEPLSISGVAYSCVLKWTYFLIYWRQLFSLMFYTRTLCLKNKIGDRETIIRKGILGTIGFIKIYFFGVMFTLVVFVSVPIYFFFFEGQLVPLIPLEFMFVDQTKTLGFVSAQMFMGLMGMYGCFATVMYGCGFLICLCNYRFQVDLVAYDLAELDAMWENPNKTTARYRYAYLCNICKKLQDMKSYLNLVKVVFERQFFLYFAVTFFGQVMCMYEIMIDKWIGGWLPGGIVFMEMISYCLAGTILTSEGEKLTKVIYNTKWYLYDIKSQSLIQKILHDSQRPAVIMLGTIGPMDGVRLISILKSMYSLYTVLAQMV